MSQDELKKFLLEAGSVVDFGDSSNGASNEAILFAETRLGLTFPEPYKWWLKNYGGGEVGGSEIYSIYTMDLNSFSDGGDIVYMNELFRKEGVVSNFELAICVTDFGEFFYLDCLQHDAYGTVKELNSGAVYARGFFGFLERFILIHSE